ncbi:MAG: U32 family peptidase [bacterium]|nr:U32 family peptidase [bacterium]
MELMVPTPNWEFLKSAIQNGADSVYIPVQGLVTISYHGVIFSKEEVSSAIEYAHKYQKKAYVVFNAKLADNQYDDILQAIKDVIPYQPDGLVLGDYRLISWVSDNFPDSNIEIIASVVCGIQSNRDANFARCMGADRIIVPWLGLKALENLKVSPKLGIDIFFDGDQEYENLPLEELVPRDFVRGVKVGANCEINDFVNIIREFRKRLDKVKDLAVY